VGWPDGARAPIADRSSFAYPSPASCGLPRVVVRDLTSSRKTPATLRPFAASKFAFGYRREATKYRSKPSPTAILPGSCTDRSPRFVGSGVACSAEILTGALAILPDVEWTVSPPQSIRPERYPKARVLTQAPRLAVVTPSFQQAHYLDQAMRSVLEQTGITCDYSVQDGGSDDGSPDLIRSHSTQLTHGRAPGITGKRTPSPAVSPSLPADRQI